MDRAVPVVSIHANYARSSQLHTAFNLYEACALMGYSYHLAMREAHFLSRRSIYSVTHMMDWIRDILYARQDRAITRLIAVALFEEKMKP